MAMKLYSDSDIQDIADAIRSKNGSSDTYKVSQMATAISNIPSGGSMPAWATAMDANDTITQGGSVFHSYPSTYTGSVYAMTLYYNSRSQYRAWYPNSNITSNDIGDSILNHLSYQYSSSYAGVFYLTSLGDQTTAPTVFSQPNVLWKYKTVTTESNGSGSTGKPVVTDKDGKIIAVYSSWSTLVTDLNNHNIDASNGICVFCAGNNPSATSGSYYRIKLTL